MTQDENTDVLPVDLDGINWTEPESWPPVIRQLFEFAAKVAFVALTEQDKKMLDVGITGTAEPMTMLFAIGERADELRQAWRAVYAINNPGPAPERTAT